MAPIPKMMKAVQISQTGGTDALEYKDVPVPTPSDGEVLVKNEYAGVNYIDTYFRRGIYQPPSLPMILGREAAGEVVSVTGSVKSLKVGDKVVYMGPPAYAEYTAVGADKAVALPDGVSTETAAAVYLQGLTAWCFVSAAAEVKKGQWAFVHAAAGGVGLLLVQMLRGVGAKVIASASTEEKLALAKENGAEWTINSHDSDIAKQVKEITGGHGVDAIFDGVGKTTFDMDLEMIAQQGHLLSFGNASGVVDPVNILRLGPQNVKLMRPVVNGYVQARPDLEKFTTELFDLIKSKKVTALIHKVYPLADTASAHTDIESRGTTGKLLLKL